MLIDEVQEELSLLKRHLGVLKIVKEKGPIGMGEISKNNEIPKHKVRYSLRILEKENLIEPTREGAITKNIDSFTEDFLEKIENESSKLEKIKEIIENLKD